jgi:signal transduction histidine kinase
MTASRASSSLTGRTLTVMVLGVLLTLVVFAFAFATLAGSRVARMQAALLSELAPTFAPPACVAAPRGWHLRLGPIAEAWAYDGETFEGSSPAAPVLSQTVRTALASGERSVAETSLWRLGGGELAARVAPSGPCGVIVVHWSPPDRPLRILLVALLIALAGVGAAASGFAWVVRPLLKRVNRVAGLAARVGTSLQGEPEDGIDDEVSQIEQALRRADAQLVADRTALEEKTQALERFLLELGHDLKTPIASLALSVDELVTAPNPEAGRSAMAELLYVEQLVENLRLEARLRQGGLVVQSVPFDLRELVERTVAGLRPLARRAGVAFESAVPDAPVPLEADRSLMERAITNLVHNALSHGARNVAVTLQALASGFELCVIDDGPGLKSPTPSARRGEGLGMKIASRSLELAGCRLVYEAGPEGVGTCAKVTPVA